MYQLQRKRADGSKTRIETSVRWTFSQKIKESGSVSKCFIYCVVCRYSYLLQMV